ncbi:GDSL lipase/esterase [Radiomyces spectabilis]|uniref:GDSL lipase/esterase n=1 Tax=Radiomyces spectabilis TaxID=64574 RepID=UPI00222057BD|nr:GDSL lipase/esterase [Radiomyces spectabilis]KAI8381527.1 GDSL lipase/esterase [Radiomyces spectabilis]
MHVCMTESRTVLCMQDDGCHAVPYANKLIIFGDSWSDNGQLNSGIANEQRQSNGWTWVEYLSMMTGADLYDYAFSGATANNSVVNRSTYDVGQQIGLFLGNESQIGQSESERSVFMIWTGVNDVHDIFTTINETEQQLETINQVVLSIENELRVLHQVASAKQLAILGLAPIDRLALFADSLEDERQQLRWLVRQYNAKLRSLARRFSAQTGTRTVFVDIHSLFDSIFLAPVIFGFAEINDTCISQAFLCEEYPNRYLWWDGWHPTTATHRLIAITVLGQLAIFDIN